MLLGADAGNVIASTLTARAVQAYCTWSITVSVAPIMAVLSCSVVLTGETNFNVFVTGGWSDLQVVDGGNLIASTVRARAFKTSGTWARASVGTPGRAVLSFTQISARISELGVLLEV